MAQYMICSTQKAGVSPMEMAGVARKFKSWQPPDGLMVEGMWGNSTGGGYALVSTDDFALVAEFVAQFSEHNESRVDPVGPAQEMAAALMRGAS